MDAYTHTILALLWSMGIAALFYYKGRSEVTLNALEIMMDTLEENGFIKTKTNPDGQKELIKIDD